MNYTQLGKAHMIFARAIDDLQSAGINTNYDDRIAATRLFTCLTAQMRQGQLGFLDTRSGKFRAFDSRGDRARSRDCEHRGRDSRTDLAEPSLKDLMAWLAGYARNNAQERPLVKRLCEVIRDYQAARSDESDTFRGRAMKDMQAYMDPYEQYERGASREDRDRIGRDRKLARRATDSESDSALSVRALCPSIATADGDWLARSVRNTYGI